MAVMNNSRNTDSFETIEGISGQAQKYVKQAVKAAGDTAAAMAGDAKQQVTGDYGSDMEKAQAQQKVLSQQQQQQVQNQGQQQLTQTRANLETLNAEIRKVRLKKEQEAKQIQQKDEKKQQEEKKAEERKKQEDPVWKKMLRKGSHETGQRVAG